MLRVCWAVISVRVWKIRREKGKAEKRAMIIVVRWRFPSTVVNDGGEDYCGCEWGTVGGLERHLGVGYKSF